MPWAELLKARLWRRRSFDADGLPILAADRFRTPRPTSIGGLGLCGARVDDVIRGARRLKTLAYTPAVGASISLWPVSTRVSMVNHGHECVHAVHSRKAAEEG
jgi:hypothetical protein